MSNHLERIAIVGVTGRLGGSFATELLKTGKHTITALTRAGGSSKVPEGIKAAPVDYDDEASVVAALKGQQFLIITLSVSAPPDTHSKILKAAAKAGVPYVMPNAYGSDIRNEALCRENIYDDQSRAKIAEVESLGMSYVSMCCGFWYEWSLALGESTLGIDIKDRKVTLFDDGKARQNYSTWEQCGRAAAALLSLPAEGASPCVADWKNKPLYISSFRVNQLDMLASVQRVTGTTDADWTVTSEESGKRYQEAVALMKSGDRAGFVKALYTRGFFPSEDGDFESKYGLANGVLGLPVESLDASTKAAVDMVESGWNPFA